MKHRIQWKISYWIERFAQGHYLSLFWIRAWEVFIGWDPRDLWIGCYWEWSLGEPFCGKRYLTIYLILIPTLVLKIERLFRP